LVLFLGMLLLQQYPMTPAMFLQYNYDV
jgi:hypothetical protein